MTDTKAIIKKVIEDSCDYTYLLGTLDISYVPRELIQSIYIAYPSGKHISLSKDVMITGFDPHKVYNWIEMPGYEKADQVKVFIDVVRLKRDVNRVVEEILLKTYKLT